MTYNFTNIPFQKVGRRIILDDQFKDYALNNVSTQRFFKSTRCCYQLPLSLREAFIENVDTDITSYRFAVVPSAVLYFHIPQESTLYTKHIELTTQES